MNRSGPWFLVLCIAFMSGAMLAAEAPASSSETPASPAKSAEQPGQLDMILLLDKSLSMAPFYDQVKNYVAGDVLEQILVPGDRLVVELVYGKIDRLLSVTIASEEDKAKVIRTIREVQANGHFTDLGAALDKAKLDLSELGRTDRPKYVLLVTDERQEAPPASPYQSNDYKLVHPSLTYTKRVDMGKYRVITVGLQVADKVNAAMPQVMQLLTDAPVRPDALLGKAKGEEGNPKALTPIAKTTQAPGSLAGVPLWLLLGAGALVVAAFATLIVFLLLLKRRKEQTEEN